MVINRVSGLVLPYSTKFLIDSVIAKHHVELLRRLVSVVLLATVIQGITSFALTQLLSKAAQRLIAELRQKVQAHISHLPVAFYDSNKTGTLVSRIMTDVEGVRNLLGTGLVDLVGGLLTSGIAMVVLFRISPVMTMLAFSFLLCFAIALNKAFSTIRPIFRQRGKINAEVTGRLAESLGGVRVIKGYHAEEREEAVFAGGVRRLLDNVMRTLTATSVMSLSASLLMGVVGAIIMYMGAHQIMAGTLTIGSFFTYTLFLGFLVAPIVQIVNIGTQITEALGGPGTHPGNSARAARRSGSQAHGYAGRHLRQSGIRPRQLQLRRQPHGVARRQFSGRTGNGDGAGRLFGLGQVHDHRTDFRFLCPDGRESPGRWSRSQHGAPRFLSHPPGSGAAGIVSV